MKTKKYKMESSDFMFGNKPVKRPAVTLKNIKVLGPKRYEISMDVDDTYNNIQTEVHVICSSGLVQGDAVRYNKSPFSKLCIETIKRGAVMWSEEHERKKNQTN
ncbi:hypothetical protein [Bacillus toyonensis]|uniref:hypothetical protein n=1 Tax=Bacillus toyonensis TaxID=155322 RepID=UPI002E217514|nr:hypothetical protein [Bacillus toyonensis]